MSTIVEVAKRARVSTATVSNVVRGTKPVSPALQERVNAAIRELDYLPNEIARSLKVKQTRMLGAVLPDITNPFFPEIIRGAEDTAFERGYFLVSANTNEQSGRERRVLSALRSYRVDGILLAPAQGNDVRQIRDTISAGIFVVCVDRTITNLATDAVLLDNVRGTRECVHHLIQRGHTRIGLVAGPQELQTGRERLLGYQQAHDEAGVPVDPKLVLEGDFHEKSGHRLGRELLQMRRKPSAIFVSSGMMTLGVLKAFEEMGIRYPEDIALATFDDSMVDRSLHPHLTAVVQPSYKIGSYAASILIDRIEGKLRKPPAVVRIAPSLIIRESTLVPQKRGI
jgi:DNA-binding LacI/PurR family transcriptional regulator